MSFNVFVQGGELGLVLLCHLDSTSLIISSNIYFFSASSLFSPSEILITYMLICFIFSHRSQRFCLFFLISSIYFKLDNFYWSIFSLINFHSCSLQSAVKPSQENFFSLRIILFNFRTSIWFFLMISISLLRFPIHFFKSSNILILTALNLKSHLLILTSLSPQGLFL